MTCGNNIITEEIFQKDFKDLMKNNKTLEEIGSQIMIANLDFDYKEK